MIARLLPPTLVLAVLACACAVETAPDPGAQDRPSTTPPTAQVPASGGRSAPAGERALVTEVVDGDTIWVLAGGRRVKIRLIGIDTPETRHPRLGVQCFGPEASAYAKRLLLGTRVSLVYDVERFDRYGRTLAYVYVGGVFVNLDLVARGFATVTTFPPNVAHVDEYIAAQRRARAATRGLWGACGLGD